MNDSKGLIIGYTILNVQQAFFDTREYNKSNFKHWE